MYRPDGDVFRPFPDALPCLTQLRELGVPCGIISNWDFSLHRILRVHGLDKFFRFVLCSDEVGYQKPDLELFQL
ncbi:HAD family hydrolase, partial [Acinetobacter baumannii]